MIILVSAEGSQTVITFDYCLTLISHQIHILPSVLHTATRFIFWNILPATLPHISFSVAPRNLPSRVLSLATEGLPPTLPAELFPPLNFLPHPCSNLPLWGKWSLIIPQTEWKCLVTFVNLTILFSLSRPRLLLPLNSSKSCLFIFNFPCTLTQSFSFPKPNLPKWHSLFFCSQVQSSATFTSNELWGWGAEYGSHDPNAATELLPSAPPWQATENAVDVECT